jgi:hypothetical protein
MKVHEKSTVFRQGEAIPFSWTEVGFMMDFPEGITLRINLSSEKERKYVIGFGACLRTWYENWSKVSFKTSDNT